MTAMHVGRSWVGTPLEDTCPCPKEPCGLVDITRANPDCTQHPPTRYKSMRQGHSADVCPAALPARINRAIQQQKAVAEAAYVLRPGEWRVVETHDDWGLPTGLWRIIATTEDAKKRTTRFVGNHFADEEVAAFSAANDPTTVLRWLGEDLDVLHRHRPHPEDPAGCFQCTRLGDELVPYPCREIRSLARRHNVAIDGGAQA